jgi:hypothetical protein
MKGFKFLIGLNFLFASMNSAYAHPVCSRVRVSCNIGSEDAYVVVYAADKAPCNIRGNVYYGYDGGEETQSHWAQATIGQGAKFEFSISKVPGVRYCHGYFVEAD